MGIKRFGTAPLKEAQVRNGSRQKCLIRKNHYVSYDNLGIARLIYQLPTTLVRYVPERSIQTGSIESLDHETLFTIQRFLKII